MRILITIPALALSTIASAQVGVDGLLGSEWDGVNFVSVGYQAGTVNGFGTPGNTNETNSYEIRLRADASYVYALVTNTDPNPSHVPAFTGANLYFSTTYATPGSGQGQIGFEVTNNRAFRPQTGVVGTTSITGGGGTFSTVTNSGVEVALPWAVFTQNSLGIDSAFTRLTSNGNDVLTMTLSQSFGYSVAGGQAGYGNSRLGQVSYSAAVPEPASMAVLGLGLAALKRRRRNG